MERAEEILTELKEIAPTLGKDTLFRIPYAVPGGFFDGFPDLLMLRIRRDVIGFSGQDAQTTSGLASPLENPEISPLDEITGISTLLAGLRKKNPYQAPQGYFETKTEIPDYELGSSFEAPGNKHGDHVTLPSAESAKNINPPLPGSHTSQARSISFWTPLMKYAVAACIIALLGITIFKTVRPGKMDPLNGLTTVSDQDMANYLDADDIHWTPGLVPETASVDFSDSDIHALFSNVSDAELQEYSPALPSGKGNVN
ncbi:MAG: hypothetical protein Q8939_18575 [Bacteroidota bacterium]|nr:hypothetical protein [Bacteroidota bacterium]